MKLQKQDVGIWVDVKDEKPPYDEYVIIKINGTGDYVKRIKLDGGDHFRRENGSGFNLSWFPHLPIYWLKEVKAVYPLTEEELEEIKKEEYVQGVSAGANLFKINN